ncbi:response regulator [Parasphingopyxis algicola]|uniref:ATP-binding protein n=1 Tax=Parasphingopyxis algicola TaxID=2026624 RepID=UPI0015A05B46|nr:ATP-binding protein [Parasphingopyxis algicola]QLC26996.1 response regulator [Parasphingopyxis algicola]
MNYGSFFYDYTPHGYCILWQPELVWTHVVSDALIALAYFSIPIAILYFIRKRPDIRFGWIATLFAAFILACGATHVMGIWTLWNGDYGIQALMKAFTALVSVITAIALWPLVPKALAVPSAAQLQSANDELSALVAERDAALVRLQSEVEERTKAEEALLQAQKIESIGRLTGGIAHDFNNLLQAASGNIELIKTRGGEDERVSRWVGNAGAAIERGKRLTSQLLSFSRTQKIELEPLSAGEVVDEVAEMIRRTIGPQIDLSIRTAPANTGVLADRTQLEMAILNLAINARDAMLEGGRLEVAVRPVELLVSERDLPAGDYVDIIVSDTGTGIDPDILARIFEPFFTTKETGQGTGLGLSMVFGMARQSGGTAFVESTGESGTTITIRLRRSHEDNAEADRDAERVAGPATLPNLEILLVDDEDDVRGAVADMLTHLGCQVIQAADGEAAVTEMLGGRFDLALLDFAMPGRSGGRVAEMLRVIRPDLPIVFISGYADTDALEQAAGGDYRLLHKPFSDHELAAAIRAAMASG